MDELLKITLKKKYEENPPWISEQSSSKTTVVSSLKSLALFTEIWDPTPLFFLCILLTHLFIALCPIICISLLLFTFTLNVFFFSSSSDLGAMFSAWASLLSALPWIFIFFGSSVVSLASFLVLSLPGAIVLSSGLCPALGLCLYHLPHTHLSCQSSRFSSSPLFEHTF